MNTDKAMKLNKKFQRIKIRKKMFIYVKGLSQINGKKDYHIEKKS